MIKQFFEWLKGLYYTPAPVAETTIQEVKMPNILVLTLIANGALADGNAVNTIQAKVTDTAGVAVAAQIISLTADAGIVTPASLVTDATGSASANITSSTAGTFNVTGTLADGTSASASVLFAAVPVVADPAPVAVEAATAVSALAAFKAKAEADIAKFVAFVEHGIEVFGQGAEADLVALKDKYQ